MKALLLISSFLMMATPAFAKEKSADLNSGETELMLHIFDDYEIKGHPVDGVCYETSTEITLQLATIYPDGTTTPDDMALISHDGGYQAIVGADKLATTALFDRVAVPKAMEGTALRRRATISAYGCGNSPNKWTIKFDDGTK